MKEERWIGEVGSALHPVQVFVAWPEGPDEPPEWLARLAERLPQGGGFDGEYFATLYPSGNVRLLAEFHEMHPDGYFVGWRRFGFWLVPDGVGGWDVKPIGRAPDGSLFDIVADWIFLALND